MSEPSSKPEASSMEAGFMSESSSKPEASSVESEIMSESTSKPEASSVESEVMSEPISKPEASAVEAERDGADVSLPDKSSSEAFSPQENPDKPLESTEANSTSFNNAMEASSDPVNITMEKDDVTPVPADNNPSNVEQSGTDKDASLVSIQKGRDLIQLWSAESVDDRFKEGFNTELIAIPSYVFGSLYCTDPSDENRILLNFTRFKTLLALLNKPAVVKKHVQVVPLSTWRTDNISAPPFACHSSMMSGRFNDEKYNDILAKKREMRTLRKKEKKEKQNALEEQLRITEAFKTIKPADPVPLDDLTPKKSNSAILKGEATPEQQKTGDATSANKKKKAKKNKGKGNQQAEASPQQMKSNISPTQGTNTKKPKATVPQKPAQNLGNTPAKILVDHKRTVNSPRNLDGTKSPKKNPEQHFPKKGQVGKVTKAREPHSTAESKRSTKRSFNENMVNRRADNGETSNPKRPFYPSSSSGYSQSMATAFPNLNLSAFANPGIHYSTPQPVPAPAAFPSRFESGSAFLREFQSERGQNQNIWNTLPSTSSNFDRIPSTHGATQQRSSLQYADVDPYSLPKHSTGYTGPTFSYGI